MASVEDGGNERCLGVVTMSGDKTPTAWCAEYGHCRLIQHDPSKSNNNGPPLTAGDWLIFSVEPNVRLPQAFIGCQVVITECPAMFTTMKPRVTPGVKLAQVIAPVLIGAVQQNGTAIAYSPFFRRVLIDGKSAAVAVAKVNAGQVLLASLIKVRPVDGCHWAVQSIVRQLDDDYGSGHENELSAKVQMDMNVREVRGRCVRLEENNSNDTRYLVDASGMQIRFGQRDYCNGADFGELREGDQLKAWIGDFHPRDDINPAREAFFVKRRREMTDDGQIAINSCSHPSTSSSSLPSCNTEANDGKKKRAAAMMGEKAVQTDEKKAEEDEDWSAMLAKGRAIYGRIVKNQPVHSAFCSHDPALLRDLFTQFNP